MLEQDMERVLMEKRCVCSYMWARSLATPQNREKKHLNSTGIPATGGRYLSPGDGCKPQVGQSDVAVRKGSSSKFIFNLGGQGVGKLYVYKAFHNFGFYVDMDEQKVTGILKIYVITIPQFSVFISNGYVQHAGAKNCWVRKRSISCLSILFRQTKARSSNPQVQLQHGYFRR